jgi:hypothetical protein
MFEMATKEMRVDSFFPSSAAFAPLMVKFEWTFVEQGILGKRLQSRNYG